MLSLYIDVAIRAVLLPEERKSFGLLCDADRSWDLMRREGCPYDFAIPFHGSLAVIFSGAGRDISFVWW